MRMGYSFPLKGGGRGFVSANPLVLLFGAVVMAGVYVVVGLAWLLAMSVWTLCVALVRGVAWLASIGARDGAVR